MVDDADHGACVNAWFERAARGLPPEQSLQALEHAFGAMWRRSRRTLGDVTLAAIVDRVLYNAAERFPILSSLTVDGDGLRFQELMIRAAGLNPAQVEEGIRFVLVEFLTVLGNLTAEVLTPALHAELLSAAPERSSVADEESRGAPADPKTEDAEGAKS